MPVTSGDDARYTDVARALLGEIASGRPSTIAIAPSLPVSPSRAKRPATKPGCSRSAVVFVAVEAPASSRAK